MKKVELKEVKHENKIGAKCKYIEPNITEDTLFVSEGEVIGFYIKDISKYSKKASGLLSISNNEFLSKRVPKQIMNRSDGFRDDKQVQQFSTIIGSIAPRPHMRRPYRNLSRIHTIESAKVFIKSMYMLSIESENIIEQIAPNLLVNQKASIKDVDDKWRFGNLFTSSISNYNISANYHVDNGNIKNTVNVIYTKRKHSRGGSLNVPDYNVTIEQADNSMLVYPAWRNMHGVTPIKEDVKGGYRNSLIFYPLKCFKGKENGQK